MTRWLIAGFAILLLLIVLAGLWPGRDSGPGRVAGYPSSPAEQGCREHATTWATQMAESNRRLFGRDRPGAFQAARDAAFFSCLKDAEKRAIEDQQTWGSHQRVEEFERLARAKRDELGSLFTMAQSADDAERQCRQSAQVSPLGVEPTYEFYRCLEMFERAAIESGQPWASRDRLEHIRRLSEQQMATHTALGSLEEAESLCRQLGNTSSNPALRDFERCMDFQHQEGVTAGRPWASRERARRSVLYDWSQGLEYQLSQKCGEGKKDACLAQEEVSRLQEQCLGGNEVSCGALDRQLVDEFGDRYRRERG